MRAIVAVDSKWGIGKNNGLLFDIKADMRHFVENTRGKTVLMGYNTLLSLPGGKPLKGRRNIVLYPEGSDDDAREKGYILARSLAKLSEILHELGENDAYVIGGAMMYHTMLPYCEEAIITKVHADGGATVFFDNLDSLDNWSLTESSPTVEDSGFAMNFCIYKNSAPLPF